MLSCLFCSQSHIIKNGQLASGGQRYKCKDCKKQFSLGGKRNTYSKDFRQTIVDLYCHQKKKAQDVIKNFGISSRTLIKWSKKHKSDCKKCNNITH